MNADHLSRSWTSGLASRMGGAANGGSAKSPEEREALDRERGVSESQDEQPPRGTDTKRDRPADTQQQPSDSR